MSEKTGNDNIPTSGDAFVTSCGFLHFAHFLYAVRGDLTGPRCREVAHDATTVLDLLGVAAPLVICSDPAAGERFVDQMDLPLLGVASRRRGALKYALRGLHAYANGLEAGRTRSLMDEGLGARAATETSRSSPRSKAPAPADDRPSPTSPEPASERATGFPDPARAAPDPETMPLPFRVLERDVMERLSDRGLPGTWADVRAVSGVVLARYSQATRRRIARTTAAAYGWSWSAFKGSGADTTAACDQFLLKLLARRCKVTATAHPAVSST